MTQELHYTSVPRGLKPGARGFCTVACTAGLSPTLAERLEGLSGYRPKYAPDHERAGDNPVAWSHVRLNAAGQSLSVVSRVGPAGLDYTDRPNKYAHHVVLDAPERPDGGPAWLLDQPGFMASEWQGPPQQLPVGRRPPRGDRAGGMCRAWADRVGDAGWAGAVAESFLNDPRRPVVLIFDPGTEVLPLFAEALALLPRNRRWDVTFQTYFTGTAPGVTCLWRGVLRDTAEERQARGNPEALLIDLAAAGRCDAAGPLVHWARTGEAPAADPAAADDVHAPVAAAPPPTPASRRPREAATSRSAAEAVPAGHDPYSLGPPPPPSATRPGSSPRGRGPREASGREGRGSGWPLAAAGAIVFLLGAAFGGAAVFFFLRSRPDAAPLVLAAPSPSQRPKVLPAPVTPPARPATTKKRPPPEPDRPGEDSVTPERGENRQVEGTAPVIGPNGEDLSALASKDPDFQPRASSKNGRRHAGNRNDQGKQTQVANRERSKPEGRGPADPPVATPGEGVKSSAGRRKKEGAGSEKPNGESGVVAKNEREPFILSYQALRTGDSDDPRKPQSFRAGGTVQKLWLIGGQDDELGKFKLFFYFDSGLLFINQRAAEGESSVAVFKLQGSNVVFEWKDESRQTPLRQALSSCVLGLEMEDGSRQYWLLQRPKLLQLPYNLDDKSKSLEKSSLTINNEQRTRWRIKWADKEDKFFNVARRQLALWRFALLPGAEGSSFDEPQSGRAALISSDALLSAQIADHQPWEIWIDSKDPPPSKNEILKYKNELKIAKNRLDTAKFNKDSQEYNAFNKSKIEAERRLERASRAIGREKALSNSRIRASLGLTIGGKRFLLPELTSPLPGASAERKP